MRLLRGRAGILLAGALLIGGLAACAGPTVAGSGSPAGTGTVVVSPEPPTSCPKNATTPGAGPAVLAPTDQPMITVTQGTNSWVASDLTQPFAIAVYPDGTAIRAEDQGLGSESLPEMTIGRLDDCHLHEAITGIQQLVGADLGEATVTDQGTTSITLRQGDSEVVVDVYALGVGDELVQPDHRAARLRLTTLIESLSAGMTQTASWEPDRLRVSAYGTPADVAGGTTWPLAGTISDALDQGGRRPCGILSGAEVDAITDALGSGPATDEWTDGTQTVVLAIGVLVPGQDCSPT